MHLNVCVSIDIITILVTCYAGKRSNGRGQLHHIDGFMRLARQTRLRET